MCELQIWDVLKLSLLHVLKDLCHWVRCLTLNSSRVWLHY